MLHRLLLPMLALGLFATEAATAQTAPASYIKVHKAQHVLSKREQKALDAQARAQAAQTSRDAAAAQAPATTTGTTWSGWSNEAMPEMHAAPHRVIGNNVSAAPGMPVNQLGHGVSTDYNGRPLRVVNVSSVSSR